MYVIRQVRNGREWFVSLIRNGRPAAYTDDVTDRIDPPICFETREDARAVLATFARHVRESHGVSAHLSAS